MFSSQVMCSSPPQPIDPSPPPSPPEPPWSLNDVSKTDKKAKAPSRKLTPHLESIHRLIKLHQQENKHSQFLLRAHHKRFLRCRRKTRKSPPLSKLGNFLVRGRQILETFCVQLNHLKSKAIGLVHHIATSLKRFALPWVPWTNHRILHCNAPIFSYSSSTVEPGPTRFDTDSILVGADVCASASVSQHKHLFTDLSPVDDLFLKGVAGKIPVVAKGTLHLPFCDDKGDLHTFSIKNSHFVPQLHMTLLCPQQWAKQREEEHGWEDAASFITKGNYAEFKWEGGNNSLTVPMDGKTNLPILSTAPSFQNTAELIAKTATPAVISDDEDSDDEDGDKAQVSSSINPQDPSLKSFPFIQCHPTNPQEPPTVVPEQVLPKDQEEFLHLHEKLGHVSFHLLKKMATSGLIPGKFKNCRIPVCASCQHGKQHKKPWRAKSTNPSPIGGKEIKQPGDCVSVDQLKSSTPGLIGQVKGWLTRERQHIATIFVDHHSDLTYVHITPSDTSIETIEAKEAFERFAANHNVTVKHYHADNGRFADSLFKQHVEDKGQSISFCGVGAHHQNGKVEKRIRDIVDQSRTMLLHASHRWPKAVSAALWPCALLHSARIRNNMSTMTEGATPLSIFSGSKVKDNVFWKHQHTFGCPAFVLDAPLQGSIGGKPKWSERSRVGVCLGHSSQHSSTVALILNPTTGHVSPQFHIVFDDLFETVKQGADCESLWQKKANIPDQLSETISVEIPHQ